MADLQADIAVVFKPSDARSRLLYNVPLNTKRMIKLSIRPKVGDNFSVTIRPPQTAWFTLTPNTGEIPFTTTLLVDTTGLEPATLYKENLIFTVNGVEIHREPIYLSTQLYDPMILQAGEPITPLNPGKKKKHILISLMTGMRIISHFIIAIGFLYVLLVVIVIIILIITIIANN